ncbi:undecaprenyl-diphosphate phosphatase [Candidatus Saccharibacteria bacterium]|nr:undecaprenyl-diphosphate phosphatase [Candidatus Saccharibacteria bacterium]
MIHILQAILLGIVEGVTEFLPISSTGHLIVAEKALGYHDVQDLFTVVVQVGAIAAVVWFYRQDLTEKTVGFFKRDAAALNFWKLLVVATIPAGIIGLALDKHMQSITTPGVVATTLILGGIVLWLVDRKPVHAGNDPVELGRITTKQALLVGLGQSVAIIPGVSRSGATIVSGLALGLNRPTATAFSFYLSIPVLVLASAYKLLKYHSDISALPGGLTALMFGLVAAFITALLSISWLLRYIAHHNFKPFAYYRIALGTLIFVLLAANWL